jgi:NADH-quinone oxidoreductase subunit C
VCLLATRDNEIGKTGLVPSSCGENWAILCSRPRPWNHQSLRARPRLAEFLPATPSTPVVLTDPRMPIQSPTFSGKEAVLQGLPDHSAIKAILAWKAQALTDAKFEFAELTMTIAPAEIRGACAALQSAGYNFFEDMTAVDWFPASPRFQLSYHLLSHELKDRIRLRVMIDEPDLAVDSIVPIWAGANYYEREVFDLFGIHFAGHPDLRRIMLPDDWKGHPLRKDYPVEGYR